MLVSGVQHCESVISIHMSPPSWTSLSPSTPSHPSRLSQSTSLSSLYYTASPVVQSCSTLYDPMDCSTPGFPVHHQLQSLLKLTSIQSVMPSNHLILCGLLFLPPSIFPSIRVFSRESALCIRWPKYCSFSFTISLWWTSYIRPVPCLDHFAGCCKVMIHVFSLFLPSVTGHVAFTFQTSTNTDTHLHTP